MLNLQFLDSGTASKFDAGVDFTAGVSFIAGDEAGGTGSVPDRLAVYGEQLSDDGRYEDLLIDGARFADGSYAPFCPNYGI